MMLTNPRQTGKNLTTSTSQKETALKLFRCAMTALLATALLLPVSATRAQNTWPNKPIRLILGLPPGASTDFLAREVAQGLSDRLKVPVLVENKPGANTIIANNIVAKAAPDGYTLYVTNIVAAINPWIYEKLPFDYRNDMRNIALLGVADNVFSVTPKVGITNAREMIAYARKNPGKIAYGSTGVGTIHNLLMELIAEQANIQVTHVPYKGAMAAMTDVIGGNITGYFGTISSMQEFIKRGDLVPLFVTSEKRSVYLPNVESLPEAGLPPVAAGYWMGLSGPAGLPDEIVDTLNKAVNSVLSDPGVIRRFSTQAVDPLGGTPQQMDRFYDEQLALWKQAALAAKLTPLKVDK